MPHILVVDDEVNIRDMLAEALKAKGHQVTTAFDGADGLEIIRNIFPDLIILDLMMPRMNGYEVLDALQSDPGFQQIPVIILTALNHRNQIVEGLQKGANDYITKPFNLQELAARVNVQLRILELENKLRDSEAYHRALFERAADPELLLDQTGDLIQANRAATELLGISHPETLGIRMHDLVHPDNQPEFDVAFSGAIEGSEIPIFEIQLSLREGRLVPVDADLCPVDIEDRPHILLHLRDIQRRKSAEARAGMIFKYIGDAVFIVDQKGTILLASDSAAPLMGMDLPSGDLVGMDIGRIQSGKNAARWKDAFTSRENRATVYEDVIRVQEDVELPLEWTWAGFEVGSEIFVIGVARDLSDRKAADAKRLEADRLKTLLEIAGGAAHEINQPLTAILGYAEMSMDTLEPSVPLHEYQKQIVDAALRINQTIKKMLALREYRTKPYANGHEIVDFDESSQPKEEEEQEP